MFTTMQTQFVEKNKKELKMSKVIHFKIYHVVLFRCLVTYLKRIVCINKFVAFKEMLTNLQVHEMFCKVKDYKRARL